MAAARAAASAAAALSRVWLYSHVLLAILHHLCTVALRAARLVAPHRLGWPPEQELQVSLMRTLFSVGNCQHWRNFCALWRITHPEDAAGLVVERVPAETFGQPGCRDSWLMSLAHELPEPRASVMIMFCHGGGFQAGDGRMYMAAFRAWMQLLAERGVAARVLGVGYPLAPEHVFPAGLRGAAAAYIWLQGQLKPGERVIVAGDSAGANLIVAMLAALRDRDSVLDGLRAPRQPQLQPPLAALLVSPACDFGSESVFARAGGLSREDQQVDYITAHMAVASLRDAYLGPGAASDGLEAPLVSPAGLASFAGLAQQFLVVWGGAEVMRHDIRRFADALSRRGDAPVAVHEELRQPHCWCMLSRPRCLLERGCAVLVPWLARVATTP